MDTAYIPTARVFVYLAVVLDWATRRVVSWRLSITTEAIFLLREAGGRHNAPWQAGDLQHRPGLAVHPRRLAAKGSLERANQATRIKSFAERGAAA